MPRHETPLITHRKRAARMGLLGPVAALLLVLSAASGARAADGLTMDTRVLFEGHARIGTWMAIEVHLRNDGPPIVGELRLTGGSQGRTRFGTPVDMPTQSDKTYVLYAQPPAFGRDVQISLVEGDRVVASSKAPFRLHEPTQLVIGIVAEDPAGIVGSLNLLPNANNIAPLSVPIGPEDLPERLEAWGTMDRLVWQDVDSTRLSPAQLGALQGWIAGGGRLVIAGGTTGPATLSAFPDAILPYRPTTTTEVSPASLQALLGEAPETATDVPALTGTMLGGGALAEVGDQAVAGERTYGAGTVTLIGFDPTVSWIADTNVADGLWRRLLPARTTVGPAMADDSQIVSAASQLPSLALPPVEGLAILLGAYILLIGPINYLVLRRMDRREWAWVTMPVLIATFAAGAYGFGSILRGSELIINEVAIVRGSPGATDASAQVYLGVFSPSRGSYQLSVPGGALLSAPISGDFFGGDGNSSTLDVLQGDPARVRDLQVGFGTLRTVRAETATTIPLVQADLHLDDGRLKGTLTNASDQVLQKPAVVLGGTVALLDDLAPGQEAAVDVAIQDFQLGQQLSDKIVGPVFFGEIRDTGDEASRLYARHSIIDQLTYDPNFGFSGQLPADGPVILAWADHTLLPVEIEGQNPRRLGNVLYYMPASLSVTGANTFRSDLLRSTVIESDAAFFSKDPFSISFAQGSATLAYRPVTFDGSIEATGLTIGLNFGGEPGIGAKPVPAKPLDVIPDCAVQDNPNCAIGFDGLPDVELYDLDSSTWVRFEHMTGGTRYSVEDPARYVDAGTGTVLIRFVNDRNESVGFSVDMTIEGTVQ